MPKVTYPRPCPTCGKELARGHFFHHKKQCGTTANRYHCQHCPLSFSYHRNLQWHVKRQHSTSPPRFTCQECGTRFATKANLKLHLETVCAEVKPSYNCVFCGGRFTRDGNRQRHMRRVHGFGFDEEDINLRLHLQHLSEEPECTEEWMFVESRPIEVGEHTICPCGQIDITNYFFLENKFNGNRTFVGSTCIANIDPRVGQVIGYFQYILTHPIEGVFVENTSEGFQTFIVKPHTVLVKGADNKVKHLNPHVFKTQDGQWHVLTKYPDRETLVPGHSYALRLKTKYVQGQLTFTAVVHSETL